MSWSDVRSILIIKPSSLGDIVHALPTARALRRLWPSASLSWLVKQRWAEVLDGNPDLDHVLAVDLSIGGWPQTIRALRADRFDLVVDLQGLLRSGVLGWLSGARHRVGFSNGREGSPWFYTHTTPVPDLSVHAVERYLLLARSLGAATDPLSSASFPLPDDPAANTRIAALLATEGIPAGASFVALNAAARWDTKRWPAESFAHVADRLQQSGAWRVVLIGSHDEEAVGRQVQGHMRTQPIDLVGKTTLKELISLLRRVRVLITNDSGPMHLAAALGTPVVAMFGPTDPIRTGPYGAGHEVLRAGIPCSPCFSRRCVNANPMECLTTIAPEAVAAAAMRCVMASDVHQEVLCHSIKNS